MGVQFIAFLISGCFLLGNNILSAAPQQTHRSFEITYVVSSMKDKIRVGHWSATGKTKQPLTVLFIQGRGSFLEKNASFMDYFADQGFETYALDLPGQGASTRLLAGTQKGHVDHFDRYLSAIEKVMEGKKNVLIVGVSLGGHMALQMGHGGSRNIKGIVAIVPMIDVYTDGYPKWIARGLCWLMTRMGFGRLYAPGKGDFKEKAYVFETNKETSDTARFEELRGAMNGYPQYVTGGPTFGWIDAAYGAMDRLRKVSYLAGIHAPVLLVSAGHDTIVDTRFDAQVCARMPRCQHVLIDGAHHNIPYEQELYRNALLRAMMEFAHKVEVSSQ